jgi:hypothetical protein
MINDDKNKNRANTFMPVRTKDGKMMYKKDGKYFSREEMEKTMKKDVSISSDGFEELKLDDASVAAKARVDETIAQTLVQIKKELKLSFTDKEKGRRFDKILESFLREIRTPKEFLYILSAPEISSGFGLAGDKAKVILDVSSRHLDFLHEKRRKGIGLPALGAATKPILLPKAAPAILVKSEITPAPKPVSKPVPKPIQDKPKVEIPKAAKKQTVDVRFEPKLVGPAEELLNMTLDDLRKLGRDYKERLDELKERFDLLKETSFAQWSVGKKNWQKSPLYAKYLEIGLRSLRENKPVKDCLSNGFIVEDFGVILELNRWLNY